MTPIARTLTRLEAATLRAHVLAEVASEDYLQRRRHHVAVFAVGLAFRKAGGPWYPARVLAVVRAVTYEAALRRLAQTCPDVARTAAGMTANPEGALFVAPLEDVLSWPYGHGDVDAGTLTVAITPREQLALRVAGHH